MEIVFHHKDISLAEDFKEIAREKLSTLTKFQVPISGFKVEIIHESNPHYGKNSHEVKISTHGSGPFFKGEGSGAKDLLAFDQAFNTMEAQIRKHHEKHGDFSRDKISQKITE
jgi:ribosomal subunit interface protein